MGSQLEKDFRRKYELFNFQLEKDLYDCTEILNKFNTMLPDDWSETVCSIRECLESKIAEIKESITLYSTVDAHSTPEYINIVLNNLIAIENYKKEMNARIISLTQSLIR